MKPTPPLDLLEVVRVLGLGQGRNRVGGVGWKGLEYMVGWVGRPRPDFCQENSCSAGDWPFKAENLLDVFGAYVHYLASIRCRRTVGRILGYLWK